jgi:hypothetical protein
MKKHTEARLEEAIVEHLAVEYMLHNVYGALKKTESATMGRKGATMRASTG